MLSRVPCSLTALNYQMHVRLRLVGVQSHEITVTKRELLPGKLADCRPQFLRRRAFRDREN
jgi:hypothetical protein